jgi:hypothetical protein
MSNSRDFRRPLKPNYCEVFYQVGLGVEVVASGLPQDRSSSFEAVVADDACKAMADANSQTTPSIGSRTKSLYIIPGVEDEIGPYGTSYLLHVR